MSFKRRKTLQNNTYAIDRKCVNMKKYKNKKSFSIFLSQKEKMGVAINISTMLTILLERRKNKNSEIVNICETINYPSIVRGVIEKYL